MPRRCFWKMNLISESILSRLPQRYMAVAFWTFAVITILMTAYQLAVDVFRFDSPLPNDPTGNPYMRDDHQLAWVISFNSLLGLAGVTLLSTNRTHKIFFFTTLAIYILWASVPRY